MTVTLARLRRLVRPLPRGPLTSRRGLIGLGLVGAVVSVATFGPFFAPHSPTAFVDRPFQAPGNGLQLGTDVLGRDVVSRVLAGGRTILLLSVIATVIGVSIGAMLGIIAGYRKGKADEVTMRVLDVALAFPQIVLALLLVSVAGPKLWLICLAVAIIHIPQVARVLRSATLQIVEEDYVRYAESIHTPGWRIAATDVLPNVVGPIVVETGLRLTYSIAIIAGLSFLGFGVQPPGADWGLMINENRIGVTTNPWPVVVPIVLIAILTIGMNLLMDSVARSVLGIDGPLPDLDAPPVDRPENAPLGLGR